VLELLTIPNARLNAAEENKETMERVEFYAGDWGLLTVRCQPSTLSAAVCRLISRTRAC
jgi:hypothetical protein